MVSLSKTAARSLLVATTFLVQPALAPVLLLVPICLGDAGLGFTISATNHGKRDLRASCYSNSFLGACKSDATNGGEVIVLNTNSDLMANMYCIKLLKEVYRVCL